MKLERPWLIQLCKQPLNDWHLAYNVRAMTFDTTARNTCAVKEAAVPIEQ